MQGGYGIWRTPQLTAAMQQASPLRVALIQPNIGMYEKQSGADREAQLDLQFGLSATTLDQRPELIIWPESMYPFGVPEHLQQLPWPAVAPMNETLGESELLMVTPVLSSGPAFKTESV